MTDLISSSVTAEDEAPHKPQGAEDWRENWWLAFFDPERGLRGLVYGGVQPVLGRAFALFALFRDDRPLYVLDTDTLGASDFDHAAGAVGPLRFTCHEPMERWEATVQTPVVQASLEWTALHDAYDWNWGAGTGSRHYEQAGRVAGSITIDNQRFDIEGFGQRDRAWGHRPASAIRSAWSSRVFWSEDDFQHASIITTNDESYLFGYRVKDGQSQLIDRLRLSPSFAYTGGPPISTELLAYSGDAVIADQQVRLANVIPRLRVEGGVESHQFFTFSKWYEGSTAQVGQLDHFWTSPFQSVHTLDVSGNNGTWCAR